MTTGVASGGSCPPESRFVGFLERRLSLAEHAELEVHVDGCATCRQLIGELSSGLPLPSAVAEAHTTYPARPTEDGELLARGTAVGRFVVLDLLGRGGMGIVYRAYDPQLDRKVALKLLRPGSRGADGARATLLAEAQVMARINHPNVIAIYEVGTYREQVVAAMELVEGTTLRRWMAERPRAWREVLDVFLLAGEGLAAAHAANVVHRDFKPENVLLDREGRVKVSDFGLAAERSPARAEIGGTPGYMAVEGFQPGGVDARGDQFSFCVALHEALHGRRPFSARIVDEFVAEVRRGPALAGARRVPARLDRVVRRGLAFAPGDRYPAMHELLAELRRTVAIQRMRRFVAAALGGLALAVAATAVAVDRRAASSPSPCAGAAEQLAGVWDSARRAAVESAFLHTAAPFAAAAFDRTAAVIDPYAAAWVAIRTEACGATLLRHEQSAALLDLRMACLDRARIQLRALSDALVAASASTVRDAATAAAALPALDACSDGDALRAIVTPPLEAVARAQIQTSPVDAPDSRHSGAGDDPAVAIRPDFRLPFACGEAWQLTARTHRPGAQRAALSLPGDESSAGFPVFVSAPGWVSRVVPDNGQVDIAHGGGWFTTYQHMIGIRVALHDYVGRGRVIGEVGNVGVKNSLGGPGPAYLHFEQVYQPGVTSATFDRDGSGHPPVFLERESFQLTTAGAQIRTSTNNCPAGGVPGSAAQYDVPVSSSRFSLSRYTQEIMTRRSGDRALFERWYNRGWNGAPLPHTIVGRPAVAVFDGELHVIARKSDGTIFDLRYDPFRGWQTTYLEGSVSGDPDVAVYGWRRRLQVAARGADGFLQHWWTAADGSWSRAVRISDVPVVGTPTLSSHYDALYIVARAAEDALWSWKMDRRGVWTVIRLPGAAGDDPDLAVDPRSGLVNVIARGGDHRIYRWQSNDPDRTVSRVSGGWSDPELVDGVHLVAGAPAAIIYEGALHVFARGLDNAMYHWSKAETWRWEAIRGSYTGNPNVYHFGGQLQSFGRAPDGSLQSVWFDHVSRIWNVENQGVMVGD